MWVDIVIITFPVVCMNTADGKRKRAVGDSRCRVVNSLTSKFCVILTVAARLYKPIRETPCYALFPRKTKYRILAAVRHRMTNGSITLQLRIARQTFCAQKMLHAVNSSVCCPNNTNGSYLKFICNRAERRRRRLYELNGTISILDAEKERRCLIIRML